MLFFDGAEQDLDLSLSLSISLRSHRRPLRISLPLIVSDPLLDLLDSERHQVRCDAPALQRGGDWLWRDIFRFRSFLLFLFLLFLSFPTETDPSGEEDMNGTSFSPSRPLKQSIRFSDNPPSSSSFPSRVV